MLLSIYNETPTIHLLFTLVTFSSQIGSSCPPELLEEFLRPGSQEFLRTPSRESVENLLREKDSRLKDPLELTESRREDETESRLDDETESRLRDPTEDAKESRRSVDPKAAIGLVSFLWEPSFLNEPTERPKASLRRVAGNADGWTLEFLLPEPRTRESLLNRLAVGR